MINNNYRYMRMVLSTPSVTLKLISLILTLHHPAGFPWFLYNSVAFSLSLPQVCGRSAESEEEEQGDGEEYVPLAIEPAWSSDLRLNHCAASQETREMNRAW